MGCYRVRMLEWRRRCCFAGNYVAPSSSSHVLMHLCRMLMGLTSGDHSRLSNVQCPPSGIPVTPELPLALPLVALVATTVCYS
jgi:hypothetical protein